MSALSLQTIFTNHFLFRASEARILMNGHDNLFHSSPFFTMVNRFSEAHHILYGFTRENTARP